MAYGNYLLRRPSGIYVVRLCVPPVMRVMVGKAELHVSTGSRDRRTASAVAAIVRARFDQVRLEWQRLDEIKVEQGSPLYAGDGYIRMVDAAAALGMAPSTLAAEMASASTAFYAIASDWRAVSVSDLRKVDIEDGQHTWVAVQAEGHATPLSGRVRLESGLEVVRSFSTQGTYSPYRLHSPEPNQGVFVQPRAVLLREEDIWVTKEAVRNLRLSYLAALRPKAVHQVALASTSTPGHLSAVSELPFSAPVPVKTRPSVGELIHQFIEAKSRGSFGETRAAWKSDEALRNWQKLRCFPELMGDLPASQLEQLPDGEELIYRYFEELCRLPTGPALARARREVPDGHAKGLQDWAALNRAPTMSASTARDYIDTLGECFRWAVEKTLLSVNAVEAAMAGHRREAQRADKARRTFTDEELARIFSAPWYRDGGPPRTERGTLSTHFRPHYYWLPLLGLFCGGRVNEMSQLYLDDFVEAPTPFIQVQLSVPGRTDQLNIDEDDGEADSVIDKSLKTKNAERAIPLHPLLVELGLLEYVRSLRRAGERRLFPELRFNRVKGYGLQSSKWFNDRFLRKQVGIAAGTGASFHSLRHNFSTQLERAGVSERQQNELLGHRRGASLAQQRYTKDSEVSSLHEAVKGLRFPLPKIAPFNAEAGLAALTIASRYKRR